MKIKGTPSSKRNSCPVCGKDHGCKIQEDKWVLCLRGMGQEDAPSGYRFIKPLRNGMGGLFVKDDKCDNWNEEQRVTRLKEQELKRRHRDRVQAQLSAKLLSIEERDRQYHLVNQDLTLTARHRFVLRDRDLTDAEIDLVVNLGAIRTWNPAQRILGVSPDLAGVDPFTRGLAGVDGIAIYGLSPDGNITGAQLKPDNQQLGKYIWLSSQSKAGSGPQLPNGELPLFVWRHPDALTITEVWLCEGALKSLIAALKLWSSGRTDIAVIGTASAARYGEQTLKDYLKRLGTKTVRIMPDAGSVINPNIAQANTETIRQLRKWGYSVRVGDWGQLFQKTQPDIDELLTEGQSQQITFITTAQFQTKTHWGNQIQKRLMSGEFQFVSDNLVELRPAANLLNNSKQSINEFFQDNIAVPIPTGSKQHQLQLYPDTIEEIRRLADADIVEIIGYHVVLTKRGKDFVGDCPFHDEKTPSFSVSPTKQTYYCFGCGESGGAIKFLMELGKHPFSDVVLDLARRYQVQAREIDGTPIAVPAAPLTFQKSAIPLNNWEQIKRYHSGINAFYQGGYFVQVAWSGETLKPEDFFALCSEGIQKKLSTIDSGWGTLYQLKLWVKRIIERYRPKLGFGKQLKSPKASSTNPPSEAIEYKPGKLPRPGECDTLPIIKFKQGQRLQVYQEVIAAGWKHILDKSSPGTWKSHDAGVMAPNAFNVKQIFYFSPGHRNPTVATVEANFRDMPIRTNGMKIDYTRKTPLGRDYIIWPNDGEKPDTRGNCHRYPLFATLRDKNIPHVDESEGSGEFDENPICASCHLLNACRHASGPGYGFKFERHSALAAERVRLSLDSAPGEKFDWSSRGAITDEALRTINPMHSVEVSIDDFERTIGKLALEAPKLIGELHHVLTPLKQLLTGELKQPYHGWNDAAVRSVLPELPPQTPDDSGYTVLDYTIAAVEGILQPDLDFLNAKPDGVSDEDFRSASKKEKRQLKRISRALRNESYRDVTEQALETVLINWLPSLLRVWALRERGALRVENGVLTIYTRNERHSEIFKAAAWNIFQDGTATPEYLSWWIGVEPNQILTVSQEVPKHNNLTIIQVSDLGQVSKIRSELCQQRVTALRTEFTQLHPDIRFIDFKNVAVVLRNSSGQYYERVTRQEGDGIWFGDSRGSNGFKEASAIASFGIPYQNIGDLEALYITLTGRTIHPEDDPEFQRFVNWMTGAEIEQCIGRLRSHLRPDEKLTFYFCANFDLSFLGLPVQQVNASDITIEAGRPGERSLEILKQGFKKLWSAGEKITQQAIVAVTGLSQGYISKLTVPFGGWKEWKKLFLLLLESPNSARNNFHSPPDGSEEVEDARWAGETYLPLLADENSGCERVQEFLSVLEIFPEHGWNQVLNSTPPKTKSQILSALLELLPRPWQQELAAML